jgi:hypothetical protein
VAFKDESMIEREQFSAFISEAVEKVKNEEDPVILNEYRKLFRQNVPFTLRMYVAAYLAKSIVAVSGKSSGNVRGEQPQRTSKKRSETIKPRQTTKKVVPADSPRTSASRVTIDESVAATIFVGIGRNRRVFPRDLVSLVIQTAGIDRERIGDIRVLDNYSFVQLFAEDADAVIAALDGYEYRGRKLSVSYSRKKEELQNIQETSDKATGTETAEPAEMDESASIDFPDSEPID